MPGHDGEIMPYKQKKTLYMNKNISFSNLPVKMNKLILFVSVIAVLVNVSCFAEDTPAAAKVPPPVLKKAVLCEKVLNRTKPVNEGVVFSSSLGRIICFTDFDPVYEETAIIHKYYFKDKFVSEKTRKLKPPGWATYSQIDLRESEKGPWRVEITDADGNIISTIRFSITD